MSQKELIVPIYLKNGAAVCGPSDFTPYGDGDAKALALCYSNCGADGLLVFDFSDGDAEHDRAIAQIKELAQAVDIPVCGGGNILRMEDVKKLIYAGCQSVFLNYAKEGNIELTHEVSSRFGKEKIFACVRTQEELEEAISHGPLLGGILSLDGAASAEKALCEREKSETCPEFVVMLKEDSFVFEQVQTVLAQEKVCGVCARSFMRPDFEQMELKHRLKASGLPVNTYESSVSWEELKKNGDGMVPVVVQDYKTQEVLMVAYMNQEAFEKTIHTGRMTYWSRSRNELWVKGLTSGHFQYVKELLVDCDNDTLLAKVHQIGAACHTGNRSCFYRTIMKKEYDETNPLKVFEEVYQVIQDRKIHPKEGSYTNYLFDKGIDKILKKVGEEATEIIIAAKNPDPEEIKYEISDFLYHVMVLMAERQVSWADITKELARR